MDKETKIKSLEEENNKLLKLLSVKEEMVSISAHQIKTSLSAIKWVIRMFLDGELGRPTSEQENLMNKVYENNERAIRITSELLLINKTENAIEKDSVFSKLDITELIEASIFNFSGEAHSKGLEIIFLTPEEKVEDVYADKEKIRVVVENVLENAIKYSDNDSGKIFITLKQIEDSLEKKKMLEISIKDNGIIISEEGKKHIFEKFFRIH